MIHDVAARLLSAGLGPAEADRKLPLFAAVWSALDALGDAPPAGETVGCWVPGRIEFLGKHTDYAGGRSLLCTVERGIAVAARARTDARVRVISAATGDLVELTFDAPIEGRAGHWGCYPATVVRRLARDFGGRGDTSLTGADIVFSSDLPIAAGMSSSSALVVAVFLALSAVNDLPSRDIYRRNIRTDEDLASYASAMESGLGFGELAGDTGVGTLSGSEDHTAMFCSQLGKLVQYAFCPVRFERAVPVPPGHLFAVASSGVAAVKTAEAMPRYNALARKAHAVTAAWRSAYGGSPATIGTVLEAHPDAMPALMALLRGTTQDGFTGPELTDRFEQFYYESAVIIPSAADALVRGDIKSLGALVDRSVAVGARLLGNQVPETLGLARMARGLGAVAASPFGAGWGGSVWALVPESSAAAFADEWRARYIAEFPERAAAAEIFVTRAGPRAMQW